jgi:hypothetical protein
MVANKGNIVSFIRPWRPCFWLQHCRSNRAMSSALTPQRRCLSMKLLYRPVAIRQSSSCPKYQTAADPTGCSAEQRLSPRNGIENNCRYPAAHRPHCVGCWHRCAPWPAHTAHPWEACGCRRTSCVRYTVSAPTLFQMTSTATHATAHHWRDELHAPARPRTRRFNPLTTTDFDIYAALDDVLAETRGISRAEAGGSVHFTGADPIVPSAMSSAGLLCLPL